MLEKPMDGDIVSHLLEHRGVDSMILAADLRIWVGQVESYQRRLGLRAFAPTGRRKRY
jgi:hypothetical protein